MRRARTSGLGALLLLCAGAAAAQLYKWQDARGVTHFSDLPPPPAAAAVTLKGPAGAAAAAALPFELAEAARKHPVVLYTGSPCAPCDQGRALLQARGIPYTEKSVASEADHAALAQAGGAGQLPLLLVGRGKHPGFEAGAWDAALTAAAYPVRSMLPRNYQPAPATPAAGPQAEPPPTTPAAAPAGPGKTGAVPARPQKLPPINAPSDFQF